MSKHTPGPWQAVGRDVLSMHAHPRDSGPLVCIVDDNDNTRWPADAALIAAAPDLLAALEAVMATRTTPWRKDAMKANQIAVAAIAKANGEKP